MTSFAVIEITAILEPPELAQLQLVRVTAIASGDSDLPADAISFVLDRYEAPLIGSHVHVEFGYVPGWADKTPKPQEQA